MLVEWWAATDSSQVHARELTSKGRGTYAVCSRAVRWKGKVEHPKLSDRCGYCRYRVGRANGIEVEIGA